MDRLEKDEIPDKYEKLSNKIGRIEAILWGLAGAAILSILF